MEFGTDFSFIGNQYRLEVDGKEYFIVEYALKSSNMPIGVATYSLSSELPEAYKKLLPTSEEIAQKIELLIER